MDEADFIPSTIVIVIYKSLFNVTAVIYFLFFLCPRPCKNLSIIPLDKLLPAAVAPLQANNDYLLILCKESTITDTRFCTNKCKYLVG